MTPNKRREVPFMLGEQVHTLQRMEIKNIFDDAAWSSVGTGRRAGVKGMKFCIIIYLDLIDFQ